MQRLGASEDFAELAPDGKQGLTGTPGQMGSLRGWGPQDKHNSRAEPGTDGHPGGQRGCTGGTGNSGRDKQEPPGCVVPWVLSAAYPHFTHWEPTSYACCTPGLGWGTPWSLWPPARGHWGCSPCPELPMSPLHFPVGPFLLGASVLAQAGARSSWLIPLAKRDTRMARDNLRQEQCPGGVTLESLAGVPVPGATFMKLSWCSGWHCPCHGAEPGWWQWW